MSFSLQDGVLETARNLLCNIGEHNSTGAKRSDETPQLKTNDRKESGIANRLVGLSPNLYFTV